MAIRVCGPMSGHVAPRFSNVGTYFGANAFANLRSLRCFPCGDGALQVLVRIGAGHRLTKPLVAFAE